VDDNGNVQYVRQGSAAEKAGLKEGMRLLAINETFIRADEFVWEREILTKTPGDVVQIEVIDLDGGKVRMTAVLDEAKQAEVRVAQASIATPPLRPLPALERP
jgi:predicted metalloprotease with PDZ domain